MVEAFSFVAFIDNDTGQAKALAKQLGFVPENQVSSIEIYRAGHVIWMIHPARNEAEQTLLDLRGPAPYTIGLFNHEADAMHPAAHIGLPAMDHADCLSLNPTIHLFQSGYVWPETNPADDLLHYTATDHFAIACPKGTLQYHSQMLIDHLDLSVTYSLNVANGDSGMQSVALANAKGNVRFPMIEPDGDTSQVQVFMNQAGGMGIQHMGLATNQIIQTVRKLKANGMRFLTIKDSYYDSPAFQSMPLSDTDKTACRELSILGDSNENGGYLLQIFSQPCLGPMMVEIIERHDHNTFGARNIKSLFETVADHQQRHALV